VSHLLDKLRGIVGDPLFVRAGRGIVAHGEGRHAGAARAAAAGRLARFRHGRRLRPATVQACITIAANDLQRDLLLPPLLQRLRAQAPGWRCVSSPPACRSAEMLRERRHASWSSRRARRTRRDIVQKRLFEDHYRCSTTPASAPRRARR
jgi:DNA-binding transcriptional LysR family regulator